MKKILILEDEPALGEAYKMVLEQVGFEVRWVPDSQSARATLAEFAPDLFLVDHGLRNSEQSGIQFLAEVRESLPAHAKVIVFSNYSDFDIAEQAKEAGADECWVKINITLKDLQKRVQDLIGN